MIEPVKKDVELSFIPDKENATITLAQNGNSKAFENLVSEYEGYVYNLAYNFFNNTLDAQDATQEIFVKVFKNIEKFNYKSKFKTWLYKIAINTCIDELRKKKERYFEYVDIETENDKLQEFPDIRGKSPEELLEEKELRLELKKIIKNLPMKYRVPIVLRDMQGLAYAEIADALSLNENTVKVRINRGRSMLREKLTKLMKQNDKLLSLISKKKERMI